MGLFNRPKSTATTNASGSDGPVDIFSHSQSYSEVLAERAERERRRKEKAEKRVKSEGKRKSDEGVEDDSPKRSRRETPKKKKSEETPMRRISGLDVGSLLREAGLPKDFDGDSEDEQIVMEDVTEQHESPSRAPRARITRTSARANGNGYSDADAIELGGSSSDEGQTNGKRRSNNAMPAEEEDDESDEELAALARQARQRRLQRTHAATPDTATKSPTPREATSRSPHTGLQAAPWPDPPVMILVYSQIANTNPLKVYRKLSQNLREIRLAWCKRQGFSETFTESVFLVHRMRKVYDVTTCKSLGLDTDAEGNITMKGAEGKEGVDQVALEAVTQDIYDKLLAQKDREDAKRRGQWEPAAEPGAEEAEAVTEPAAEEFIGLVFRARGKPDFKLRVKPVSQPLSLSNRSHLANIKLLDHTLLQDNQCVQKDIPRGRW